MPGEAFSYIASLLQVSTTGKIDVDIDDFEENKENALLAPILLSFEQLFGHEIDTEPFDEVLDPNLQEYDQICKINQTLNSLKSLIAAIDDSHVQEFALTLPKLNLVCTSSIKSAGSGKLIQQLFSKHVLSLFEDRIEYLKSKE